ncbi:M16 family metallopeptidase [Neisseria animaloris]|uniref:M16 family metallopeptidase n=1 Tax=Neisseria animaloris TaxID=326522 RepID=UPI000D30E568|nr:insulinase family protein [Neisseria animaloris]
MLFIRLILIMSVVSAALFVHAGETAHIQGKLANGLAYHIFHVPSADKRLVLRLQVNVGAADENEEEEGLAHIVEHMVFQSAPDFPSGLSDALNGQGWQLGRHYNAQTGYYFTRYLLTPPQGKKQLGNALAVYRQILSPRSFSPADWTKEKQVILSEWRQQQTLEGRLKRQEHALLYSGSRQARYAPIGSKTAIENARIEAIDAFRQKWYGSNNAVLVVMGDIDPEKTATAIETSLGRLKPIPLPERSLEEYEPVLKTGWHTGYVRDKDNTDHKIALVFRFGNALSQSNNTEGYYQRLLDNFAAYIIHRRIEQSGQPVSLKSGNIGKKTGSLGFYMDVAPNRHAAATDNLRELHQHILQQPATDEEVAAYRKILHGNMKPTGLADDLNQTVLLVDNILLNGKPLPTVENRKTERGQLYRINVAAVNKRIGEWLNADDKLLIIQASNSEKPVPPNINPLPAGKLKVATQPVADKTFFAVHKGQGRIVSEGYDSDNKVSYLQFENGDKAVLLQHPSANGKLYFKAVSETGYLHSGVNAWQAQLAAKIIANSAPAGFTATQLKQWQQQQGIKFAYQLSGDKQITDAQVPQAGFEKLLQLYRSRQTAPTTDNWQETLEAEAVKLPIYLQSVPGRQELELEQLRFGVPESRPANGDEIRALDRGELLNQWQKLVSSPVNYYIVSNMPSEKIKTLLAQYLGDIPRRTAVHSVPALQEGATLRRAPINDTDGTDVNAWSWQAFYDWTPDTSEQIPLLVNLANARLKDELRSRRQSAYGVKFTAMPQPSHNRVESNLFFSTTPERAAEAWQAAQQVLTRLPENISKTEAYNLQRLFIEQEAKRRQNPEVWLERLAASHRHYGDARYLGRLPELHRTIIQTRLRQTAKLLWLEQNARALLIDPQK